MLSLKKAIFKGNLSFQGADIRSDLLLVDLAESIQFDEIPTPAASAGGEILLQIVKDEKIELPTLIRPGSEKIQKFDESRGFPLQLLDRDDLELGIPNFPIDEDDIKRLEVQRNSESRFETYNAEREACRMQKLSFKKNGKRQEADQMYVREMRIGRKAQRVENGIAGTIKAVSEWLIADFSCGYGTDWQRVLSFSLVIILINSVLFWIGDTVDIGGSMEVASSGTPVRTPYLYFYYSLVTFTTLGSGTVTPTGLLAIISAVEAVLGTIFAALIVAVFIRKWAG